MEFILNENKTLTFISTHYKKNAAKTVTLLQEFAIT